jgi:phospholipid/cholesterol/gamma-HCH transport system substrate-binding protein
MEGLMSRRAEIQVGVTVIVALAILLWGVTWLKEFSLQRSVRVWTVRFPQTGGLGPSDEVQVNGIRKGAVQSMELRGDQVIVKLGLATDVELTSDSRVAIRNVGLMGEKVIAVDLRMSGMPLTVRDTIAGEYEKGIPEVMAELGNTVGVVSDLTEQLSALADAMNKQGDFAGTMKNFKETSQELKAAVKENRRSLTTTLENLAAVSRTAKGLTTDREAELQKAVRNFASAAEKMDRLAGRLDSLRTTMQSVAGKVDRGDGSLGRLVNDDKLYSDLSTSVSEFKLLLEDIKKNPKKYINLSIF